MLGYCLTSTGTIKEGQSFQETRRVKGMIVLVEPLGMKRGPCKVIRQPGIVIIALISHGERK